MASLVGALVPRTLLLVVAGWRTSSSSRRSFRCEVLRCAVAKAKPSGSMGTFLKKISLSSTMGPGLKVDVGSVIG